MPSPLIIQAEAPNDRFYFYPLWLEYMFGHLMNAAVSIYYLLLFLGNSIAMIVTFGAPYLQYRLYRHDGEDNEASSYEKYSEMIKGLDILWDQYSSFLLYILPVLFPMVSLLGGSPCSIAGFTATITFIVGAASIGTRIIFRVKAKVLHSEYVGNDWLKASQSSWNKVPNKSFWILFALPNVFFFFSVGLLILTVMLVFWGHPSSGVTRGLGTQACTVGRLRAFRYTLLTVLVATITHLAFVIIKLYIFTAFLTAELSSAV